MSELTRTREDQREHDWIVYDDDHRACRHCGLRLFFKSGDSTHGGRGWVLLNYWGVTSPLLLGGGGEMRFGGCTTPVEPPIAESVIIDYTGDPDVYPMCERFMHRVPPSSAAGALLDLRTLTPVCGYKPTWWELGPARVHDGWTWCAECWGGAWGGKKRQREMRAWRVEPRPRPLLK